MSTMIGTRLHSPNNAAAAATMEIGRHKAGIDWAEVSWRGYFEGPPWDIKP